MRFYCIKREIGISEQVLGWVGAFRFDCSMNVLVGGIDSSSVEVTSGVPQRSVVGPLLILIYVHSLADDLLCDWFSFADNSKLYAYYWNCSELYWNC